MEPLLDVNTNNHAKTSNLFGEFEVLGSERTRKGDVRAREDR